MKIYNDHLKFIKMIVLSFVNVQRPPVLDFFVSLTPCFSGLYLTIAKRLDRYPLFFYLICNITGDERYLCYAYSHNKVPIDYTNLQM